MDTLWRSRNPTTVVTATGEGQTIEEAQVYVHDLDLFGLIFYHLEHFAKKRDIPASGPTVNNRGRPNKERKIDAKKEIAYV